MQPAESTLHEEHSPGCHCVTLRLGDQVISRTFVRDVRIRIGSVPVLLAGIAGVWTHEQHRNKGHASRVMRRCLEYMARRRYPLSGLWGITDFYHRFGYVPCCPGDPTCTVTANTRIPPDAAFRIMPATPRDLAAILRLYAAENAARTGSAVRTRANWTGFRHGDTYLHKPRVLVATDHRGCVAAYAAYDLRDGKLVVAESTGRDRRACRPLLRHFIRLAHRHKLDRLELRLPPDSAMADCCRTDGALFQAWFCKNSGGMARVIDQAALLRALAPELSRRLRSSPFARWSGSARVRTELGTDTLLIRRGRVAHASEPASTRPAPGLRMTQQALAQLAFGYRRADDVLAEHDNRLSAHDRRLIAALFPMQWPYLWHPDRY